AVAGQFPLVSVVVGGGACVSVCVGGAEVSVFSFGFGVSFGFVVAVVSVVDGLVLVAAVVLDESGGGSVDVRSPSLSGGRVVVRAGAVVVRVRDQRIPSDGVTYGCCCCGTTITRRAGGGVCMGVPVGGTDGMGAAVIDPSGGN